MALRSFTRKEALLYIESRPPTGPNLFYEILKQAISQPAEHTVYYFRNENRFLYVPPEDFYLGPRADAVFTIFDTRKP